MPAEIAQNEASLSSRRRCNGCLSAITIDAAGLPGVGAAAGDAPQFEDTKVDTLLNPGLIIEVLSQSTESDDRGAKFAHYRNLPSLNHYLLVSQTECRVEHFARQTGNRWLLTEYQAPDDSIPLTDMDCSLRLVDIYERLSFPARPEPTPGEVAEGTADQPR
nr:Uma2 family endonuclease [Thiocystis violacea]